MTGEAFIESIRLDGEEWREYPGSDGKYMASTLGRILSFKRKLPRILKQVKYIERHKLYYSVCLSLNNTQVKIRVHRVIALTFLDNPNNYTEIDHINGDSLDNRVENLKWCSHKQNMRNVVTRERLKLSHKEAKPWYTRVPGINPRVKRPVVQLKNGTVVKVFPGIIDTRNEGFCAEDVGQACRKILKSHRGYQWVYLDEYEKSTSSSNSRE